MSNLGRRSALAEIVASLRLAVVLVCCFSLLARDVLLLFKQSVAVRELNLSCARLCIEAAASVLEYHQHRRRVYAEGLRTLTLCRRNVKKRRVHAHRPDL